MVRCAETVEVRHVLREAPSDHGIDLHGEAVSTLIDWKDGRRLRVFPITDKGKSEFVGNRPEELLHDIEAEQPIRTR